MALLDPLLDLFRRKPSPYKSEGGPGVAVFGGYVEEGETNAKVAGHQKWQTYTNILANTSIVAASVRFFINLLAKAQWNVEAANPDDPKAVEIAERFEKALNDMTTPWHRVVRRAGLYRYYGFSIQEWTAKKNDDGTIGILDVEGRPQHTIEQWAVDESGTVQGVVQRSPQTFKAIPLDRRRLVYVVDDSITDSPEGLGLFRHVVKAVERLEEYERLEGIGFETDLRGIPVGRAPFMELKKAVQAGTITQDQMDAQLAAMRTFLTKHKRTANLALFLDSAVYQSTGDNRTPSGTPQWQLDLLKAGATSAPELAAAIARLNREVARILGTENILLGESGAGSLAMAEDKSNQFALIVDGTLKELAEAFQADLVKPFMELNGWDPELTPKLKPEKIQHRAVQEVTAALRDMASAGAVMAPDDPAINEVRRLLGLSEIDLEKAAEDAAINADLERKAMEAEVAALNGKTPEGATPNGGPEETPQTKEPPK
jgi:hypothetical protein